MSYPHALPSLVLLLSLCVSFIAPVGWLEAGDASPHESITAITVATGQHPRDVAIHPGRPLALVGNEKDDNIVAVSLPTAMVVDSLSLGAKPRAIAIDPDRELAVVVLEEEHRVAIIDLTEFEVIAEVETGLEPRSVAIDVASGVALVGNRGADTISVIELDSRAVTASIPVGRGPSAIAIQGDERRAWVALEQDDSVQILDLYSRESLAVLPVGRRPAGVAVSPMHRIAAVTSPNDDRLTLFDIDSHEVITSVHIDKMPQGVAIDEQDGRVYVSGRVTDQVLVIDLESAEVIDEIPVGRQPEALAVDGLARIAVVANRVSNDVTLLVLPDTIDPEITVDYPPDHYLTNEPEITLQGRVSKTADLAINDEPVALDSDLHFRHATQLIEGGNPVRLVAIDEAGNTGELELTIHLDTVPPALPDAGLIDVSEPVDGKVTVSGAGGSVEADSLVTVTNRRSGESATTIAGADGSFMLELPGEAGDTYEINATDGAGNRSEATEIATAPPLSLPPDPAAGAPPLDRTIATTLYDASGFLHAGPDPVQSGVEPGLIDAERVAVLRGRVQDRNGAPLPGVTISVQWRPGFGHTLSRGDGAFDLAVNGGGRIIVNYEKEGYLPVQRGIDTPWQDYAWLPDVVMIELDPEVTTIDLSAAVPVQVARGTAVTDEDGQRQATVLFKEGTRAELVFADGTTQSLATLDVRATEYTVGDSGPAAMPGELPPASGYTYAVELSVDEAIAAGATEVRFDRPVYSYVENFLDFPVGGGVPSGWYDRDRAAWIPSGDGRVIEVVAITSGLAEVDVDGDGQPADAEALDALDITDAEREALAVLYAPGQSLWRVPVDHFTPWDYNWPFGPPLDATEPDVPDPVIDAREEEPHCVQGSIIECENSALGLARPVVGTPFTLNYRSHQVPGRRAAYSLSIPLSGDSLPDSLRNIYLEIQVAGRLIRQSFPAQANLVHEFVWDGQDAYGREVQGEQDATVRIGYAYDLVYHEPADFARSFGAAGGAPLSASRQRAEAVLWKMTTQRIGLFDARSAGLGAWTLDSHHVFSPPGILYRGDGTRRGMQDTGRIITTVAGDGSFGFSGDGGPATDAQLGHPIGMVVADDGTLLFADGGFYGISDTDINRRVRSVSPDGVMSTVAGGGSALGDGGPADEAALSFPTAVAVAPDGSLYIADGAVSGDDDGIGHRIRHVGRDGIITTVAGTGVAGFSGDGGPAIEAQIWQPMGLVVAPDGSIYISDWMNCRIRRVAPDGIITTVVGVDGCSTSFFAPPGDGGPATQATLQAPAGLALGPDGSLYIADNMAHRIRRVTPDGMISTVAGGGSVSSFNDLAEGVLATQARLIEPSDVAVARDGSLYIAEQTFSLVRRVAVDGTITTVAGKPDSWGYGGEEIPARESTLGTPTGVAVGPDQALYISDRTSRIRKVSPSQVAIALADGYLVASDDGSEHYVFDTSGRHLRSMDSVTGALIYRFEYDDHGYLAAIDDEHGNRVRITRSGEGVPSAVVSPDGHQTMLFVDTGGFLSGLANPAGDTFSITNTADGLLTALTDPRGHQSSYQYDDGGRLVSTGDAAGGGWTLSRSELEQGHQTRLTSATGEVSRYRVDQLPEGDRVRSHVRPDDTVESMHFQRSGRQVHVSADGTEQEMTTGPDPRFRMTAPVPETIKVTTPGGLVSETTTERMAILSQAGDLLSHEELTETVTRNGHAYTRHYTADDRTWRQTLPSGRASSAVLSPEARLLHRQHGGLAGIQYEYDPRGRLTGLVATTGGEDARVHAFNRDSAGYLASVIDPLGHSTGFEYDDAGRVIRQVLADGREIVYDYDPNGNLVSITPPGRDAHRFEFGAVNLESAYLPPELPDTEPQTATITRYHHDLDRRLMRIDRPDGTSVAFGRDSGGRLATVDIPQGQYRLDYSPVTGQLNRITAPDGHTLELEWDGFLPMSENVTGEVSGTVSYIHDNNFWLSGIVVDGDPVDYARDDDGLLVSAGDLAILRDDDSGLPIETVLGDVVTSNAYNPFAELVNHAASFDDQSLMEFEYVRDALGRVVSRQGTVAGVGISETYDYDPAGRLTGVTRNGVTTTWGYDANGNRTHVNGVEVAVHDEHDRLMTYGAVSHAYSANGELVGRTDGGATTGYEYDAFGNLHRVSLPGDVVIDYLIDGRDRRIGKRVNGELVQGFLYQDQLNPVAELDGDGQIVSRFVYANKAHVPAWMIREDVTYRILTDHLGSPRLVIDATTGEIAQHLDYDVWGNVILDTNPGFQPFGFAGGIHDLHTGLVRFGARDYDPSTGRWTAKDPILFRGGDTNLYGYAINDPVNFIDPDGRIVLNLISGSVGAVLGGFRAHQQGDSIVSGAIVGFLGTAMTGRMISNLAMGFMGNLAMQSLDECLDGFSWAEATTAAALNVYDLGRRFPWQPNLLSGTEIVAQEAVVQVLEGRISRAVGLMF